MTFRLPAVFVAIATLCLCPSRSVHAAAIQGLFNTGVSGSNTALGQNEIDPHWTIEASPTFLGSGTTPNYNGNARADWVTAWTTNTPNTATSTWIVPDLAVLLPGQFEDQDVNANMGLFTFQTTFTIPEAFASAQITGLWAADNFGGQVPDYNVNNPEPSAINNFIRLNGNVIAPGLQVYGFEAQAFTISSGFVQGLNTLEFNVSNTFGVSIPNPIGTQIVFTSATYAVPEPPVSILAASGIGVAGFRHFRRRRKT